MAAHVGNTAGSPSASSRDLKMRRPGGNSLTQQEKDSCRIRFGLKTDGAWPGILSGTASRLAFRRHLGRLNNHSRAANLGAPFILVQRLEGKVASKPYQGFGTMEL